jgi:hypothetical protein
LISGSECPALVKANNGEIVLMEVILNPSRLTIELPDKVGDLAKAFSSGMMDEDELKILAAASTLAPVFPHVIAVEIGTYVGATAVFLATVLRELGRQMPILSIDAFSRVQPDALNPQGNLSEYLDNIKAYSFESVCMPLVALSADAAVMVPSRIGLLIVDGGHAYPIVNSDLELYTPKNALHDRISLAWPLQRRGAGKLFRKSHRWCRAFGVGAYRMGADHATRHAAG